MISNPERGSDCDASFPESGEALMEIGTLSLSAFNVTTESNVVVDLNVASNLGHILSKPNMNSHSPSYDESFLANNPSVSDDLHKPLVTLFGKAKSKKRRRRRRWNPIPLVYCRSRHWNMPPSSSQCPVEPSGPSGELLIKEPAAASNLPDPINVCSFPSQRNPRNSAIQDWDVCKKLGITSPLSDSEMIRVLEAIETEHLSKFNSLR